MNIPTLSLSNFIKIITSPAEKNNDQKKIKIIPIGLRRRQRIENKKSNSNSENYIEINNDYKIILDVIKKLIPEIEEENHYNILILTRLAFHLRLKHDINTDVIIKKYLKLYFYTKKPIRPTIQLLLDFFPIWYDLSH